MSCEGFLHNILCHVLEYITNDIKYSKEDWFTAYVLYKILEGNVPIPDFKNGTTLAKGQIFTFLQQELTRLFLLTMVEKHKRYAQSSQLKSYEIMKKN